MNKVRVDRHEGFAPQALARGVINEALRWEEQRSIASARKLMAQRVAARREAVIREGRSEMA